MRAGLVEDPKDDRWCGYGAAAAGDATAREALAAVVAMAQRRPQVAQELGQALATYRMWPSDRGRSGKEQLRTVDRSGRDFRGRWCRRQAGHAEASKD
ncbi:MAG: hypothetical protein KF791_10700 [Verrucomicrobiae bacterium]|nr:hypothetical protein [Verrucomicrobiae bacterium]